MIKNRAQKPAAMDSCFGLVRPHQHGTASSAELLAGFHIPYLHLDVEGCCLTDCNQITLLFWEF